MIFGQGCYDGEDIPPFRPICDHPDVPPSAAMTFDVPMRSFVPPTPPNECVCFSFESKKGAVTTKCSADKCQCSVDIKQLDTDCCTGRYEVTPHIEVPCLPFTIKPAVATVSVGLLPKATLTFEPHCTDCSLTPKLDIVVPVPIAPAACFEVVGDKNSNTQFQLSVKYKDKQGAEQTKNANFTISKPVGTGCSTYKISSPSTLDLTGIGGSFGNGGDVNVVTIDGNDVLAIDGGADDEYTWYGGGYGNRESDAPEYIYCRGSKMRNGYSPSDYKSTSVPTASIPQQQLVSEDGEASFKWTSSRYNSTTKEYVSGSGALDMLLPSGFEWHAPTGTGTAIRGVAVTFSEFLFNSAGSLAEEGECAAAVLLAPGIAVATTGYNKSGLKVDKDGLSVNVGRGLHVVTGCSSKRANDGRTEVHANDKDFVFYGTAKTKVDDAKLTVNDTFGDTDGIAHYGTGGIWTRNAGNELVIRFMTNLSISVDSAGNIIPHPAYGYMRILKNGVVLSFIDKSTDDRPPRDSELDIGRADSTTNFVVTQCGT